MRCVLLVIAACSSPPAPGPAKPLVTSSSRPQPAAEQATAETVHEPVSVVICELEETAQSPNRFAAKLHAALLAAARERQWMRMAPTRCAIVDEKLLANCPTEELPCMLTIAERLRADVLVYGQIDDAGAATLRSLTVSRKHVLTFARTVTDDTLRGVAIEAIDGLVR